MRRNLRTTKQAADAWWGGSGVDSSGTTLVARQRAAGPGILASELAYYMSKAKRFGIPLDSRHTYTEPTWIGLFAALARTDAEFASLIEPIWEYANSTSSRLPFADLYDTVTGRDSSRGMHARPVIGALFARMLVS